MEPEGADTLSGDIRLMAFIRNEPIDYDYKSPLTEEDFNTMPTGLHRREAKQPTTYDFKSPTR